MGSYAECWLGSFYVGSTKNDVDPGLLTLVRPEDKRVVPAQKDSLPNVVRRWHHDIEDEDVIDTVFYCTSAAVVRDRLELQGYTLNAAKDAFAISLEARVRDLRDWLTREHGSLFEREYNLLKTVSVESWMDALREIKINGLMHNFHGPTHEWDGTLRAYMLNHEWYGYEGPDLKVGLRLALDACSDDDEFVYDVTDLVLAGDFDADADLVAYAVGLSASAYANSGKIVILTEGRSDSRVLSASLRLLYPHLADYYSFLDFDAARLGGGAGNLVTLVKAFASAGIVNRIVAVFDNDTAATSALRGLGALPLPANLRVLKLPALTLLSQYPTLGPAGKATLDVNGIAGSLELYFGVDVLTDATGQLAPVQWTGFDTSLCQYQGEVISKAALQEKFAERVARCQADRSVLSITDWAGIRAVLEQIFVAFREADRNDIHEFHRQYHAAQ